MGIKVRDFLDCCVMPWDKVIIYRNGDNHNNFKALGSYCIHHNIPEKLMRESISKWDVIITQEEDGYDMVTITIELERG